MIAAVWKEIKDIYMRGMNFLQQDVIGPWILMIYAMVMSMIALTYRSMDGYIYVMIFVLGSILFYIYTLYQVPRKTLTRLYRTRGCWALCCSMLPWILQKSIVLPNRTVLASTTIGFLLVIYICAHIYKYLVADGEQDILFAPYTPRIYIGLLVLAVFLGCVYMTMYPYIGPILYRVSVGFVCIRQGGYRWFALGALLMLLGCMMFLLLENNELSNVASVYCYYFLCTTVVFALVTKK